MTQSNDDVAVEVTGLSKRFGRSVALNDLSFRVPRGEITGFVGPNGSGKTTTLRVLATLLKQDNGQALVFGYDTRSPAAARHVRHMIGFMPDYFGLYRDMTPAEYLDFFGAAYRVPAARRQRLVDDILSLVNLAEKRDTLVSGLSRGMQQKLSLGRALVHSPDLLLLDEPASGLDPRARIELMELLRELRNMGKTIFVSSHILSELHNLCDSVVIIEDGHAVYAGRLEQASDNVMHGRHYVELTVEGDPDGAARVLDAMGGVRGLRRKKALFLVEHAPDISSADIIASCDKGGVRLLEAKRGSANLEDVFMTLTGREEEEAGGSDR